MDAGHNFLCGAFGHSVKMAFGRIRTRSGIRAHSGIWAHSGTLDAFGHSVCEHRLCQDINDV